MPPLPHPLSATAPARRALRVLLVLLLPLLLAWALHQASQAPAPPPDARLLHLVAAHRADGPGLQPPAQAGRPQSLPLRLSRADADAPAVATWLRVLLPPVDARGSVWTLELRYRPTVLVLLDGQVVAHSAAPRDGDVPPAGFELGGRLLRIDLPPDRLQGSGHELAIRIGAPGAAGALLSSLWLGPQAAMAERSQAQALETVPRTLTTAAACVVGVFLVLLWLLVRHENEWLYGLAGLHLLLLALLLSAYLPEVPPLPDPWWRLLLDAADVGAKAILLVIVARLALAQPGRVIALAMAYALAGLLIDGWAAWHMLSWGDFRHSWPWWALGSRAAVFGLAWALALLAVWRRATLETLGTACAVGLSATLWAYVSWFALVRPGALAVVDLNYVAHAGWVLLLGVLLLGRFAGTLRREARLRAELAQALRQRTQELAGSFEALQASERARAEAERARAVADERERLMQEMHDGIGAQLIAARLQVAAGGLPAAQAAALIDDCLAELRLTVDALSLDDGDLGALLAALRQRLAPGLRAAGIALDWQVQPTPLLPVLQGPGARELLRLVQEAVSNVLHHARATRLAVATAVVDGAVQLSVRDDGLGRAADVPAGRGTRSMRSRAQRLGAQLDWISPAEGGRGTEVRLRLPLP
ncbi:MAG: hypothetical protein KBC73_02565 [Burkholderiaceae bacterium]|nr:hypothetical protein [Burkholderiaceae bacterium]